MRLPNLYATLVAGLIFLSGPALGQCRQAIVLALDVSGSVNDREYVAQTQGLADALLDPEVVALFLDNPEAPIAVLAFEWSSQNHQIPLSDWVFVRTRQDLVGLSNRIRATAKHRQGLKTAMGQALIYAGTRLGEVAACWRHTVDISIDGQNNIGPTPMQVSSGPGFARVTINALIVAGQKSDVQSKQESTLVDYATRAVLHGPGAFYVVAQGYDDYTHAMRRKLIRELQPIIIGTLHNPPCPPSNAAQKRLC